MKTQLIIILCSLTLAYCSHQHLKENAREHHKKEHGEDRIIILPPHPLENCTWVCDEEQPQGGLLIFYKAGIVAALNTTTDVAIIISQKGILLFDGKNQKGAVTKGSSDQFFTTRCPWSAYKIHFDAYFEETITLEYLENASKNAGVKIDASKFWINFTEIVQIIIKSSFTSHVSILYKSQGSFIISHDLKWFINVNIGLIKLIQSSPHLSKAVQSSNIEMKALFNAKSGFELLINFLIQLGGSVDLTTVVPQLVKNPEELLIVAQQLSGGSTQGLDGWVNILVQIIGILRGHGSIQELFTASVNYQQLGSVNFKELREIHKKMQILVDTQDKKYHNAAALKGMLSFTKALSQGTVVLDNVNISDVLKFLPQGPIGFVTKILQRYGSSFGGNHGVPDFFKIILSSLNVTGNADVLHNLLPGVDQNIFKNLNQNGSISILQQVFQGGDISKIFSQHGDIFKQIGKVPVLGNVVGQISKGLGGASNVGEFFNGGSITKTIEGAVSSFEGSGSFLGDFSGFGGISEIPFFGGIGGIDIFNERHRSPHAKGNKAEERQHHH